MHERIRHIAMGSIATLLGGALFAFLVHKTGTNLILSSLHSFGLPLFCAFVGISLLNFCLYTLRWKIILEEIEKTKKVSYTRLFLHRMSGFATGYLTPGAQVAGEPVRVALLLGEGISPQTATSSVVLDLAFEIAAFLVYVVLGVVLAFTTGVGAGLFGAVAYSVLVLLLLIMTLFFLSIVKGWNGIATLAQKPFFAKHPRIRLALEWLVGVEEMMTRFFSGRARMLAAVIALSCAMTGFRAVEMGFIAWGFGEAIPLSDAILLSTIPGLVLLVPVPGGLGLFEASTAAMLAALGIPTPAIAFTLIIRLRDFFFILLGVIHGVSEGTGWLGRRKDKPLVG
jgi:uncharacterized protein (TIRG00374 family)